MDAALLGQAVVLGFTIAAAVGPISLLTIRRTIAHGRLYGLVSGIGVALADASYAAIAAFGLTAVTTVLVGARVVLGVAGGTLVAWLGWRTLRTRPTRPAEAGETRPGLLGALASIYALTMTNPTTILSFAGLFAALGLVGAGGAAAATVTLGVLAGSGLWWVVLTTVVGAVRTRVTLGALTWVNRLSGLALIAFGLAAVGGVLLGAR